LVTKGRMLVQILIEASKVAATKTKILNALANLKTAGDIESATWKLTSEEYPEEGTV